MTRLPFSSLRVRFALLVLLALVPTVVAMLYTTADDWQRDPAAGLIDVLLMGVGVALALVMAWVSIELFVVRRAHALLSATQRLAAGDLSARSGVSYGVSELSQLARAFDQMVEALEQREAERQRAEEALRESEKRFRALIENSSDAFSLIDSEGKILYRSPSAGRLVGIPDGELVGTNMLERVWSDDLNDVKHAFAQVLQSPGQPIAFQFRAQDKGGLPRWMEGVGTNLLTDPAVHAVVVNYRDVTERKRVEAVLQRTEARHRALLSAIPDLMLRIRRDGVVLDYRDPKGIGLDAPPSEFLGKAIADVFPAGLARQVTTCIEQALQTGQIQIVEYQLPLDGDMHDYEARTVASAPDESLILVRDITERKRAEEALRESEERYRMLAETAHDMIFIINREGKVDYVNGFAAQQIGCSPEEIVGRSHAELFRPGDAERQWSRLDEVLRAGQPLYVENLTQFPRQRMWLDTWLVPIKDEAGQVKAALGISRDITDRKRAEEALRRSEEAYRLLFEQSIDGIVVVAQGRVVSANHAFCALYNLPVEKVVGTNALDLMHPEEQNWGGQRMEAVQSGEPASERNVYRAVREDGSVFWVESQGRRIEWEGQPAIQTIVRDVTQRKQAEEALRRSEKRFRSITETASDAIIIFDKDENISFWNPAAQAIFGYQGGETLGKLLESIMSPQCSQVLWEEMTRVISTGRSDLAGKTIELVGVRKNGSEFPIELSLAAWKTGEETYFTIIVRDITERRRAEEQLKASLKEKELLLKEIHHRVKNNLQVIVSLLSLQAEHIKDRRTLGMFEESQNRVRSMALIHERLYQSQNLAQVDLAGYVQNLMEHLFYSFGADPEAVGLKVDVQDVSLPIDAAIPCGLIVNELVSNCLKHAFPARTRTGGRKERREICVKMHSENGRVTLVVSDNGVGFPKSVDFRNTRSLGMQLVVVLTDQLGGNIELDTGHGTAFKVTFAAGE